MHRLLPRSKLAVLITLMEQHKHCHPDLYEYLTLAYSAHGGSTLYPVHKDGAICLQLHLREFEAQERPSGPGFCAASAGPGTPAE